MKHYVLVKNNEILQHYHADSKPTISENKGTVYEYKETAQPEYNPLTEKLTLSHRVYYGKYEQVWTVEALTPSEDWKYPEFQKRIVAPDALLLDDVGSKVFNWFTGKGLPFENHGANIRLYFNDVLPQHQTLVGQFEGVITIEEKP